MKEIYSSIIPAAVREKSTSIALPCLVLSVFLILAIHVHQKKPETERERRRLRLSFGRPELFFCSRRLPSFLPPTCSSLHKSGYLSEHSKKPCTLLFHFVILRVEFSPQPHQTRQPTLHRQRKTVLTPPLATLPFLPVIPTKDLLKLKLSTNLHQDPTSH